MELFTDWKIMHLQIKVIIGPVLFSYGADFFFFKSKSITCSELIILNNVTHGELMHCLILGAQTMLFVFKEWRHSFWMINLTIYPDNCH